MDLQGLGSEIVLVSSSPLQVRCRPRQRDLTEAASSSSDEMMGGAGAGAGTGASGRVTVTGRNFGTDAAEVGEEDGEEALAKQMADCPDSGTMTDVRRRDIAPMVGEEEDGELGAGVGELREP
eukprot:2082496-Rhodomonas_salina.1